LALSEALGDAQAKLAADRASKAPDLMSADTDTRFLRIFAATMSVEQRGASVTNWKSVCGRAVATITRSRRGVRLEFDPRSDPTFADYVASQLDELYTAFQSLAKAPIEKM
jgi:hypothetical protein